MPDDSFYPGEWPDISAPGSYQRLVNLARRRLVGREHHAEDVVSRALIKWTRVPAGRLGVARLEQVIMSEAYSLLRGESRLGERERRTANDRSGAGSGAGAGSHDGVEQLMLRRAISETLRRHQIEISHQDLEVLDLLWAGYTVAEVARILGSSRYFVNRSRHKWRRIARLADDVRVRGAE